MKKFTGWLGVCLEYSDDTTGGHQLAYVFFFKDLQVGLDVKTGGAGEYSADQIINKSLLVVPCEI